MIWPFGAELIGACQGPITATNNKRVDSFLDKISRSSESSLSRSESHGTRSTDESTPL